MLWLADPGNPSSIKAAESLNRAYLGTGTRALGLLTGSMLAIGLAPSERRPGRAFGRLLNAGSVLALVALVLMMMFWIQDQTPFLYRGGFLLVDGLTVLVIAALVAPQASWTRRVLGWKPLELCGQRAYGLYLWHWPVFRLLAAGQHSWGLFLLRLAVTACLTEGSYRFVEKPLHQRDAWRWLNRSAEGIPFWRRHVPRFAALLLVLASLLETHALARRAPYFDPVQASIQAGAQALDQLAPVLPKDQPMTPPPGDQPAKAATRRSVAASPELDPVVMPDELQGARVTAVGDSVMKGAAIALKKMGEASLGEGMIQINAEECRSFGMAGQILRGYQQEKRLGEVVVIHLGTNNSAISNGQFRSLMAMLGDRRLVLFLTVKSDNSKACEKVNQALESLVLEFPNARVFDWSGAADPHPEYFYSDHTHLRPEGAQFYARTILTQVSALPAEPNPKND
jgi:hypothetical protein